MFDHSVAAAREAWLDTALAALSDTSVDGIFVDKAGASVRITGVSAKRVAAWNAGPSSAPIRASSYVQRALL